MFWVILARAFRPPNHPGGSMIERCGFPTGRRCALPLLVVVVVVAAAVLAGSGSASSTLGTTTTLTSDVVHYLGAATLLGPVPASRQITVGVVLENANGAAEDAYLAQLYDPSSSNYQQFLDPDAFNLQFGVPSTTFQAAQAWLTGAGLTVTPVEGAT